MSLLQTFYFHITYFDAIYSVFQNFQFSNIVGQPAGRNL